MIVGSVYGLVNSPRLWHKEVVRRMLAAGWVQHSLDPAFFLRWSEDGALLALAGIHVDDMISCFGTSPEAQQAKQALKDAFEWSEFKTDEFLYCGRSVKADRLNKAILVNMPDFINGTDVRMPQRHGRLEHSLSPAELTEFRSSIGCMQWCSATARADVSADCSLLQQSEKDLKV